MIAIDIIFVKKIVKFVFLTSFLLLHNYNSPKKQRKIEKDSTLLTTLPALVMTESPPKKKVPHMIHRKVTAPMPLRYRR